MLKDCKTGKAQWTVEAPASILKCFVGTQLISALSSFQVGCSMHVLVPSQMGCEVHGLNKVNCTGPCHAKHVTCFIAGGRYLEGWTDASCPNLQLFLYCIDLFQCIPQHLCSQNVQALIWKSAFACQALTCHAVNDG